MARDREHSLGGFRNRIARFSQEEVNWPGTTIPSDVLESLVSARERRRNPCHKCSLAGTPLCPKQQGGDSASCAYVVRAEER